MPVRLLSRPVPGVPDVRRPARRPDGALLVPPAAALAIMLWGLNGPSYWRDEADTVSAVARSLPQLIRMLGHVDAVHGLYYLLLWPVAQVAGTGEMATRLPSALAMAAAAFCVAAIARRLVSRRAALCAGLLFAALPEASMQGHNARPYAMVIAAATASSYLLLRVAEDPRRARVAGYGLSLVLLGYLHMFALLLVPVHAIALAGPGGVRPHQLFRRWLAAAAAACAAVVPLVLLGWAQRGQIGWISRPGWHEASQLVVALTGGAVLASGLIGLLAAGGAVRLGRAGPGASGARAGGGRRLAWLAVPWLVLPPVVLFAVSAVKPVYYLPYVLFCLPATALLGGAFLAGLSWPARGGRRGAGGRAHHPHADRDPGAGQRRVTVAGRPDPGRRGAAGRRDHLPAGRHPAVGSRLRRRVRAAAGHRPGGTGRGHGPVSTGSACRDPCCCTANAGCAGSGSPRSGRSGAASAGIWRPGSGWPASGSRSAPRCGCGSTSRQVRRAGRMAHAAADSQPSSGGQQ